MSDHKLMIETQPAPGGTPPAPRLELGGYWLEDAGYPWCGCRWSSSRRSRKPAMSKEKLPIETQPGPAGAADTAAGAGAEGGRWAMSERHLTITRLFQPQLQHKQLAGSWGQRKVAAGAAVWAVAGADRFRVWRASAGRG